VANTIPIPFYDVPPYQRGFTVTTTTTINVAEIAQVLLKGQQLLADLALNAGYASLYHQKDKFTCLRLELYLMLYAIQDWDTTADALNYYDQTHLIALMSKVEQLFYICSVTPAC
jgi:hypothetical protein